MKLRTRIAVIAALAVAVAVVAVALGGYFAARNELVSEVDRSLAERVRTLAPLAGGPGGFEFDMRPRMGRNEAFPRGAFDQVYVQLVDQSGVTAAPPANLTLPVADADLAVAAGSGKTLFRDLTVDDVHLRMITARFSDGQAIQIARPLDEVDATLSGLALLLTFVGLGGVVVAAGLGLVVARSTLRPIERLTSAAEHVAETQELTARIDVERDDEIGRLAGSFNSMLAALEQSRDQQRRLVHDAGHELRTPLTALRTNIEVLARTRDMPEEQRRQLMSDVTFELEELSNLVGEVVDLASEARSAEEPVVGLRLDELVSRAVDRAERRTGRRIELSAEPVVVSGREAMLERAVSNLLENADKWSPSGEKIEVLVEAGRVTVRDHGPGIDIADRPFVFDRFYRSPAARTLPGSGLGLAIVQQIVDAHGGSVFVDDTPGGGATVGFVVPTA